MGLPLHGGHMPMGGTVADVPGSSFFTDTSSRLLVQKVNSDTIQNSSAARESVFFIVLGFS